MGEHYLESNCFKLYLLHYRPKRQVNSKKYGCDIVRCTHASNAILCSSNKIDGERYIRYCIIMIGCHRYGEIPVTT